MAEIYPFRALHYNPAVIRNLADMVTQPYDKITPEMQARYYELSPYNLVRIIRGREGPRNHSRDNVYTRAAQALREWIETRVLVSASEPAIYPYHQEYALPGHPGVKKMRRGFIALGRIEDYSAGIVHRHEETLSGPKADRLELLKATRAHFGQIFMLYTDPEGKIEAALASHLKGPAWERVNDEHGTLHSVWRVQEPRAIEPVVEAMRAKKLVIADGHHRYETALAYRNYCRTQTLPDDRAEYVMMTFIRMESDGLTILPTQRVVHSLSGFEWQSFRTRSRDFFELEDFHVEGPVETWVSRLEQMLSELGRTRSTVGVYVGAGTAALLRARKDLDLAGILTDLPASLRQLDVVILHRLLLEEVLGIDRQAVREEKHLRYVRQFDAAIHEVDSGHAQIVFLLNPTPIRAVWENALAGHVLPQKSTDFYPKLLSGLTIYCLDNPAGM